MFDPRPELGRPDRALRDALRPAPPAPVAGADVQAQSVVFTVGVTAARSPDGSITVAPSTPVTEPVARPAADRRAGFIAAALRGGVAPLAPMASRPRSEVRGS